MRHLNWVLVGLLGVNLTVASTQTELSWWDHTKCTVTFQGWGCPEPEQAVSTTSSPSVSSPVARASAARTSVVSHSSIPAVVRTSTTASAVPANGPGPDSGMTVSPEGHLYTKDGQIIMTGLGDNKKPLTYEPGMKVVYGPDGQPTHVEGDNMCYIADFADPSTVPASVLGTSTRPAGVSSVVPGTAASSPLDFTNLAPGTSEPSQNEAIIAAARKGEGLPAGATVEQINLYNQNLAIPYRPIDTDCGANFMGPPKPDSFCGPQGSPLAQSRSIPPVRSQDAEPSVSSPADIQELTSSVDPTPRVSTPSERVSPGVSMAQSVDTPGSVTNPQDLVERAVQAADTELTSVEPTPAASRTVAAVSEPAGTVVTDTVGATADDIAAVDAVIAAAPSDVVSGTPRFFSEGSSALTSDEDRDNDRLLAGDTVTRDPDTDAAEADFIRDLHGLDVDEDEPIVVAASSTGPVIPASDTAIVAAAPIRPVVADDASTLDLAAVRAQRSIRGDRVIIRDGVAVTEDGAVVVGKQVTVSQDAVPTVTQQDLVNAGATTEEIREHCGDADGEALANCVRNNPYMGQYIWILTTTASPQ